MARRKRRTRNPYAPSVQSKMDYGRNRNSHLRQLDRELASGADRHDQERRARSRRGAGRIRDRGKSHELMEFIRQYKGPSKFMQARRLDAFDDRWTPSFAQADVVRKIMAEEAERAVGRPIAEPDVLVTEVVALPTADQQVVIDWARAYRRDNLPYVMSLKRKIMDPSWRPSASDVAWLAKRCPELLEVVLVSELDSIDVTVVGAPA